MLPAGHIAAGFMTAKALLHFAHPSVTATEQYKLLWIGAFLGFSPDLDFFYYFLKHKTFLVAGKDAVEDPHRKFLSHAPIYWLIAGLLVYFLAGSLYWKYIGLLIWLCSWSHFLLDSIEYGIPWLHPLTNRLFALTNVEYKQVIAEKHFVKHTLVFLKLYSKRLTGRLEILVIILGIYFLIK